jgi:hypothetical protein
MAGHAGVSWIRPGRDAGVKRGVIGRQFVKIKDWRPICYQSTARLPEYEAVVNHDFMLG